MLTLTPEQRQQIQLNVMPLVDALVEELTKQVEAALRDRIMAVLGLPQAPPPTPAKAKPKKAKKRAPDNGTGKRHPPRKDLSDRDKAVKKRKGDEVRISQLDDELATFSRDMVQRSLRKLARYKLIEKKGYGRGTSYALAP